MCRECISYKVRIKIRHGGEILVIIPFAICWLLMMVGSFFSHQHTMCFCVRKCTGSCIHIREDEKNHMIKCKSRKMFAKKWQLAILIILGPREIFFAYFILFGMF